MKLFFTTFVLLFFLNFTYSQNQFLDSSFGNNGIVITDGGYNKTDIAYTTAITEDQKILVAGKGNDSNNTSFSLIIRYNSDGSIDTNFGQNGKYTINNILLQNFAIDIKVLISGKILVLGGAYTSNPSNCQLFVTRLNEDGTLDNSFGTNGYKMLYNSEGANYPKGMFIDNDENIYIIDEITPEVNSNTHKFCLYKLNSNGNNDTTFGSDGNSITLAGSNAKSYLFPDGKILIATSEYPNDSNFLTIYKFNSNGSLDTNFNNSGSQNITFDNLSLDINAIFVSNDNKIIVTASTIDVSTYQRFALAKLNFNGTFDTTFGINGKKDFAFANNIGEFAYAWGINSFLTSDNKIIYSGFWSDNGSYSHFDFILRKTDLDGNIDSTFGNNGQVDIDFGNSSIDYLFNSILQSDGKIVCVGQTNTNTFSNSNFGIARVNNSFLSTEEVVTTNDAFLKNTINPFQIMEAD